MKDVFRKLKKHWITVWLVVVIVILGTFVTLAAYTEVSSVKRVVTTKSAPKELFSSNCMYADLYERRMPAPEFNVNVCNYDQSNPEIPNQTDIEYTLTAQLRVKYNGTIMTFSQLRTALADDTAKYDSIVNRATAYSIAKTQNNNVSGIIDIPEPKKFSDYVSNDYTVVFGTSTSHETLPGGVVSTDRFKVTIPESDFEKTTPEFFVYVKADPVDNGLTDIQTLLYGSKNVVITASWSGMLAEQNTKDVDYDFYNYIITGSGSGKLDIMWNPDWFEVDNFFFSNLSGVQFDGSSTPTEISSGTYTGWNQVTIVVDSSDSGKSRYGLQLYKVKGNTSYTGDNNAANHIHCELQQ